MKRAIALTTKKVNALSTMTRWATRKYSPAVARMSPERSATLDPKREFATKKRTITVAKAKRADGIPATLSGAPPRALKVSARAQFE